MELLPIFKHALMISYFVFVMLTQFPVTALLLFVLLFVAGIFCAWISDKLIKILGVVTCESCMQAQCKKCMPGADDAIYPGDIFRFSNLFENFRTLSFTRFLLLVLIISFMALVILGIIGPPVWNWKRITFISLCLSSLFIGMIVSEHYLYDHIWEHIIKRHVFRVFLWSFGALLFLHAGLAFWNLDTFIHEHKVWVLLIAGLLGIGGILFFLGL
jgi:hypothetical protein